MADCDARCDDKYSSLLNQLYLSLAIGGSSLILFETFSRLRRPNLPNHEDKNKYRSEKFIFGYLYQFKSFLDPPSSPHPKWPLKWILQVIKLDRSEIISRLGGDAAAYIHWLRVCLCFTFSQTLTIVPILLPIHFHFSASISSSSMNTASLTHLIENESGKRLMYVHVILYIYTSLSWLIALLWLINGTINIREQLAFKSIDHTHNETHSDPSWKSKSIMVTNIPTRLRDERVLASYFAFYLNRFKKKKTTLSRRSSVMSFTSFLERFDGSGNANALNNTDDLDDITDALIEDVCVVRKYNKLVQLRKRHEDCTKRLELAYMTLARRLLKYVKRRLTQSMRGVSLSSEDEVLVQVIAPFVYEFEKPRKLSQAVRSTANKLLRRSDAFVKFPDTPVSTKEHSTIWEAILLLPTHTLEPFQSKIRVKPLIQSVLRNNAREERSISEIHYLTHKLRLLTSSIEEHQTHTPTVFAPTSTAFVTLKYVSDARVACRKLSSHPTRPHACIVSPAPFYNEIDWDVAISSQSKSLTLRTLIIKVGVWGFILFYIIPMAALSSLFSIERLRNVNERLGAYFDEHERQAEWFTTLLPTLIVAFISLMMPAILFGIGKKATPHLTISRLHDQIFHRYWVFMITNVLITFCIGAATFRFILESFSGSASGLSILSRVYLSFPQAAPFFASWAILQTSIQNLVQLALIGLPLLTFFCVTLSAKTPRQRLKATNARTPDYHVFCSNTLLVISVCLVMGVFNPLVIPFTFVYFIAANIVYRNQLYHVYSRRLYDSGGRWITVRCFRYGMDALSVSQVAFFAFHLVRYEDGRQDHAGTYTIIVGVLFVVTQVVKLLITRQIKARFNALEFLDGLWKSGETLTYTEILNTKTLELKYAEYIEEKHNSRALNSDENGHDESFAYKVRNFFLCTHFTPTTFILDLRKEVLARLSNLRRKFIPIVSRSKRIPSEILAQKYNSSSVNNGGMDERVSEAVELGESGEVLNASDAPEAPLFDAKMRSDSHIFTSLSTDNFKRPTLMNRLNTQSHEIFKPIINLGTKLDRSNNRIDKVGLGTEAENKDEFEVVKHTRAQLGSDAPDESRAYNCPFYDELLEPFLLLPTDPTSNIDLDDLVELHYGKSQLDTQSDQDESPTSPTSDHLGSDSPASRFDSYDYINLSTLHTSTRHSQTFKDSLSPKLGNRWIDSDLE